MDEIEAEKRLQHLIRMVKEEDGWSQDRNTLPPAVGRPAVWGQGAEVGG